MKSEPLVTVVIRTKNEERWIIQCLRSVFEQEYKNFEVVIVDNESTDKTIERAKHFGIIKKIIKCSDYLPGKALNMGIREANGDYIACLSGHCIPINNKWLSNLLRNFEDKGVAGVYGRQEPVSFTSDFDKRDLALIFGLDRKVQIRDSFFHNANSMIRRDVWMKLPFNDAVTNIEDRIWAQKVMQRGYRIIYDPEASVYHYHGIHHDGDVERCTNVVRILESLHKGYAYRSIEIEKLNIVALIPIRGEIKYLNGKPLLAYTVQRAQESKYIKRAVVSTDNPRLAAIAKDMGVEAPFLRDAYLSKDYVDLDQVLRYSLERLEENKIFPDLVVSLEATFPFRPKGLLDEMIMQLTKNGLDSIIAARRENKALWKERDGKIIQLDEGLTPRQFKEPTFIELRGVGMVTHPEFLRGGIDLGQKIGFYEVTDPYSHLEVRNSDEFELASTLINKIFK
jgi:rhamnosyltransferase